MHFCSYHKCLSTNAGAQGFSTSINLGMWSSLEQGILGEVHPVEYELQSRIKSFQWPSFIVHETIFHAPTVLMMGAAEAASFLEATLH